MPACHIVTGLTPTTPPGPPPGLIPASAGDLLHVYMSGGVVISPVGPTWERPISGVGPLAGAVDVLTFPNGKSAQGMMFTPNHMLKLAHANSPFTTLAGDWICTIILKGEAIEGMVPLGNGAYSNPNGFFLQFIAANGGLFVNRYLANRQATITMTDGTVILTFGNQGGSGKSFAESSGSSSGLQTHAAYGSFNGGTDDTWLGAYPGDQTNCWTSDGVHGRIYEICLTQGTFSDAQLLALHTTIRN